MAQPTTKRPRTKRDRERASATDGGRKKRPRAASTATDDEEDERMLRGLCGLARTTLLGLPLFVLMGGIGVMCIALLTSDDLPVAIRKILELAGKEVLLA